MERKINQYIYSVVALSEGCVLSYKNRKFLADYGTHYEYRVALNDNRGASLIFDSSVGFCKRGRHLTYKEALEGVSRRFVYKDSEFINTESLLEGLNFNSYSVEYGVRFNKINADLKKSNSLLSRNGYTYKDLYNNIISLSNAIIKIQSVNEEKELLKLNIDWSVIGNGVASAIDFIKSIKINGDNTKNLNFKDMLDIEVGRLYKKHSDLLEDFDGLERKIDYNSSEITLKSLVKSVNEYISDEFIKKYNRVEFDSSDSGKSFYYNIQNKVKVRLSSHNLSVYGGGSRFINGKFVYMGMPDINIVLGERVMRVQKRNEKFIDFDNFSVVFDMIDDFLSGNVVSIKESVDIQDIYNKLSDIEINTDINVIGNLYVRLHKEDSGFSISAGYNNKDIEDTDGFKLYFDSIEDKVFVSGFKYGDFILDTEFKGLSLGSLLGIEELEDMYKSLVDLAIDKNKKIEKDFSAEL